MMSYTYVQDYLWLPI